MYMSEMRGHAIHDDTYNAYPFSSAVAVSRDNRALCDFCLLLTDLVLWVLWNGDSALYFTLVD